MLQRLRARNEWRFFAALPRADRLLATLWWAVLLLRGVLPALFAIAMGMLVALSAMIDRRLVLKPKQYDDWMVRPILWVLLNARPSTKKSPVLNEASHFAVQVDAADAQKYREEVKLAEHLKPAAAAR